MWARELRVDLDAWRRGDLSWSSLSAGVCFVGPPGTGKTLFAQTLSTFLSSGSYSVPLIECSLSQWQGADEAHRGHLLRAMRRDFEQARAKAPSLLFIDEIDSFADRSKVKHAHADYVVEVVNGLLAQLDGVASREGIVCVGASNDIGRCDPAILRPGRLGKIIRISLPTERELERMFRVRLRGLLEKTDLSEICMLALGSTGAEVERITNDALRSARHGGGDLALSDLRAVIVGNDDRAAVDLEIAAIHEAGHLVSEIELFGNEADVHANIAAVGIRGGCTTRTKAPPFSGTYYDYARRLQVLLAGRTAEELLLSAASPWCGRATRLRSAGRSLDGSGNVCILGHRRKVQAALPRRRRPHRRTSFVPRSQGGGEPRTCEGGESRASLTIAAQTGAAGDRAQAVEGQTPRWIDGRGHNSKDRGRQERTKGLTGPADEREAFAARDLTRRHYVERARIGTKSA